MVSDTVKIVKSHSARKLLDKWLNYPTPDIRSNSSYCSIEQVIVYIHLYSERVILNSKWKSKKYKMYLHSGSERS